MSLLAKKQQVLEILTENLNNPHPQVVNSSFIAEKLRLNMKDTCQLLKTMHDMGVIISDIDCQHSLITQEGLNSLAR